LKLREKFKLSIADSEDTIPGTNAQYNKLSHKIGT
jgi:hypothetical protein